MTSRTKKTSEVAFCLRVTGFRDQTKMHILEHMYGCLGNQTKDITNTSNEELSSGTGEMVWACFVATGPGDFTKEV